MRTVIAAGLALGVSTGMRAEEINIQYINKPPYYDAQSENEPKGLLVDLTRRIFTRAGLTPRYQQRPAKRIWLELGVNEAPFCSIGWYRTLDRAAMAKYSLGFFRNRPMIVVTHPTRESQVRAYPTLQALMADARLTLSVSDGIDYGPYIETLITANRAHIERPTVDPLINLRKVEMGRVDYMILEPEEYEYFVAQSLVDLKKLVRIDFPDVPPGAQRHIVCSKRTSDEVIHRLNEAIVSLDLADPDALARR